MHFQMMTISYLCGKIVNDFRVNTAAFPPYTYIDTIRRHVVVFYTKYMNEGGCIFYSDEQVESVLLGVIVNISVIVFSQFSCLDADQDISVLHCWIYLSKPQAAGAAIKQWQRNNDEIVLVLVLAIEGNQALAVGDCVKHAVFAHLLHQPFCRKRKREQEPEKATMKTFVLSIATDAAL